MDFIINNLVVLLATVGIVSAIILYWDCNRTTYTNSTVTGRFSGTSPNYSNIPTSVGKSTMEYIH